MRLVDREQREPRAREQVQAARRQQRSGRHKADQVAGEQAVRPRRIPRRRRGFNTAALTPASRECATGRPSAQSAVRRRYRTPRATAQRVARATPPPVGISTRQSPPPATCAAISLGPRRRTGQAVFSTESAAGAMVASVEQLSAVNDYAGLQFSRRVADSWCIPAGDAQAEHRRRPASATRLMAAPSKVDLLPPQTEDWTSRDFSVDRTHGANGRGVRHLVGSA